MVVLVREASAWGPCNVLGELMGETSTRYLYRPRSGSAVAFVDKRSRAIHVQPCDACPDSPG